MIDSSWKMKKKLRYSYYNDICKVMRFYTPDNYFDYSEFPRMSTRTNFNPSMDE